MRVNSESLGGQITVDRDQRVTRVGSLLRHYKLDELPQLINVLLGEMSLVGPRPEVPKFVEFYTREDKEIIHSVKPGITDNASIEYINESQLLIEFSNAEENYIKEILPRKIDLYKIYIANRSFFGDIKIIFHTIFSIFR